MKYMGSKRGMLRNGLGEALDAAAADACRIVDLFTGSAAVAHHAASRYRLPVVATDLQHFAVALADSIVSRTTPDDVEAWWPNWHEAADALLRQNNLTKEAESLQLRLGSLSPQAAAFEARSISEGAPLGTLTAAYGGYYYSPLQALWLDVFRATLPDKPHQRSIALAALIQVGSKCAAAPGHTAQPFKPNDSAGPFLLEAWKRDVPSLILNSAKPLGARYSQSKGSAFKADALEAATQTRPGDLVFLDPPYSSVHYSRFYHVLESISQGSVDEVSGTGRYPATDKRPSSDFSLVRRASTALEALLQTISERGAHALVTFPAGEASNGLSGDLVRELAERYFSIKEAKVTSRFSTLGGDAKSRAARQDAHELILTLSPLR